MTGRCGPTRLVIARRLLHAVVGSAAAVLSFVAPAHAAPAEAEPAPVSAAPASTATEATEAPVPVATEATEARVAVIGAPDADITTRLVAELGFLGFAPEVVPSPPVTDPDALLQLARDHEAAAAIAVDIDGSRVRVWIVDRVTGKLVARELALPETDAREIAVRSVELLRASLAEVDDRPPPPEAEAPVTPVVRRAIRDPPRRIVLAGGVGVGAAPGGVPVQAHARMHLRYSPHTGFGVLVQGSAPLFAARVSAAEGQAEIRTGWLGVGPWFGLRRRAAVVVPDLSATVGPVFVAMQGQPTPGNLGRRALLVDALFETTAGVEIAVSTRVRLRFEGSAGVCARTVRVRFADRPVATWCRPHVLGAAGIGVALW